MANIIKRESAKGEVSYRIRVHVDRNKSGKQTQKSMTYKPEPGMTPKQIEKELNKRVLEFETKIKSGLSAFDGTVKFEDYAAAWLESAQLAFKTRERYVSLLARINDAIGHIKLQSLQARHLETFYRNLEEDGIKDKGAYAVAGGLGGIIKAKGLTRGKLAGLAGIAASTAGVACAGGHVSIGVAEKICAALDMPLRKVFEAQEGTTGLSDKTIKHHHALISSILGKAKLERIVQFNVALEHMKAPKVKKKEARYLTYEQAWELVALLWNEDDIRLKTSIMLMLHSGVRRGELCGLSWQDVDEKRGVIHVLRASQYQSGNGIVETATKNESSRRSIKIPEAMFRQLAEYREWWNEQRLLNGDRWQGRENRLFIQSDGKPINPDTINYWLNKFIDKHGLEPFSPHSLRHTYATLQIAAGVDIRSLQARTGHAQASTLTDIYSHELKTASEAACDALEDMLTPKGERPAAAALKLAARLA